MRTEVRIAGFGGQGVISAGIIVGRAATLYDGINAVQTQSIGPEARGGASRAEVVLSDEDISYPKVMAPDILVAMSHEALVSYIGDLREGATIILDPDFADESDVEDIIKEKKLKVFYARVTKKADEIGLRIVANIVMIGAISKLTNIISYDAAKKAFLDTIPKGTEEKNTQAFEAGYAMDGT